jgi:hypothetical protein
MYIYIYININCMHYSLEGLGKEKCDIVPKGFYLQKAAIVPCPLNTFSSEEGSDSLLSCKPCPPGWISTEGFGSTRCSPCPNGCTSCAWNFHNNNMQVKNLICTEGCISNVLGQTENNACKKCKSLNHFSSLGFTIVEDRGGCYLTPNKHSMALQKAVMHSIVIIGKIGDWRSWSITSDPCVNKWEMVKCIDGVVVKIENTLRDFDISVSAFSFLFHKCILYAFMK